MKEEITDLVIGIVTGGGLNRMYEVIKTDKERFAIREVGSQGVWILGTNIIVDSDSSNIAVFKDKQLAYKEAIRLNCTDSKLFVNI